ncbi:MAG: ABC transporter permease [Gammaproteobacteria bacterium]|nr:ABC transporter permease [Gammaproteobacteria bacterium]
MLLKANLKEALASLYMAKRRSLLALIGIIIGIASVIAMVSVGTIAKREALEQFKELGVNYLAIDAIGLEQQMRLADALALPKETSSIAAVAPWVEGDNEIIFAGKKVGRTSTLGVTGSFARINKLQLEQGRSISDLDFRRHFCVIGAEIASALRDAGTQRLVGESIRLDRHVFTIVGVLRDVPRGGGHDFDAARSILVPLSTAQRMFSRRGVRRVAARMASDAHHTVATAEVKNYFRRKMPNLEIKVGSAQKLIEQMERQMQTFALLLAAVGSISLIVGGVGIMNVMLASVNERRKEIGIRRALGARRVDIQSQFLTESVVLSLLGGVFGILVGVVSTWLFCWFTGWTFLVSPAAALMGFAAACSVGVFFGLHPAIHAARLDPITALRSD